MVNTFPQIIGIHKMGYEDEFTCSWWNQSMFGTTSTMWLIVEREKSFNESKSCCI